jgi:hypothetical protein
MVDQGNGETLTGRKRKRYKIKIFTVFPTVNIEIGQKFKFRSVCVTVPLPLNRYLDRWQPSQTVTDHDSSLP